MMTNLVYDRTTEDVAEVRRLLWKLDPEVGEELTDEEWAKWNAGMKGAYNYTDMNRVELAVKTLAAALTAAGYPVEVTPVLKGSSRVPAGYTEVEWIQSSGTQYIDTGFAGANGVRVVANVNFTSITASGNKTALWGVHDTSEPYGRSYLGINSEKKAEIGGGNGYLTYGGFAFETGKFYEIDASNVPTAGYLKVDGSVQASTSGQAFAAPFSPNNIWLFAVNISTGQWFTKASAKLKSLDIYDGGVNLIRQYVPCKNPDGAVGLYDLVGGEFYGNSGTGAFTAGAEVGKAEDREWQEGDVLYRPQWTTYLDNVQKLRDAYYTLAETGKLPAPEDKLGYIGANNIEKILADIDLLIDCMKASYRRCGTFRAGNNAVHLPLKGSI